jgi:hypothetical protein
MMLDSDLLNSGGIYRLVVVADDGFLTKPFLGVWNDLAIKDGAIMCEFIFAHGTCSLANFDKISENGLLFSSKISFDLPKISDILQKWLYLNAERRWVLFAEDFNEYTHIIGEPEVGCYLSTNQATGERSSGKNLTSFILQGSSIFRPITKAMSILDLTATNSLQIDLRRYSKRDFLVYEGDTINQVLVFRDNTGTIENLTGSSFKMQIRDLTGVVITSFTMGAGFSLQNSDTEILMFSANLIPAGDYVYDLERTYPDATIETQMKGQFLIEKQITI